jgi:thioesterase domain-containing protein
LIGFQTRGIQGHNPHHTIEAMAAENIRYLRQHQPRGPYLIAGYSGGALTAFEMARQLEAQDADVERLFVLDTYAPGFASDFRPKIKLGWSERLLGEANLLYEEGFGFFYERLMFKVRGKLIRGPILRLMKRVSLSRYRYQQMQKVFRTAARQYRHASTIECPVTLFRTRPKQLLKRRAHELDPTLGWGSVSRGGCFDAETVSGDHLQMLESENARKLAEMIEARIKP